MYQIDLKTGSENRKKWFFGQNRHILNLGPYWLPFRKNHAFLMFRDLYSSKKAPATIQNPKKINFFPFLTSTTFPGFYRPKIPPKFSWGAARRNWKKNQFSRFSLPNPIIHYTKNSKNPANWSEKDLRKSKKVIFQSKPSYPPMLTLLVYFLIKSRFLHLSWRVFVKKIRLAILKLKKIGFSQKRSFFPIFTPKSYNTLH